MPDLLQKVPFTPQLLSFVQDFDCGDEEWERPLAAWIKAAPDDANGTLHLMSDPKHELQVWLHVNDRRQVVGYSSLGKSKWRWPDPQDKRVPISVIPNVAIQKRFWGLPENDPPKYSTQAPRPPHPRGPPPHRPAPSPRPLRGPAQRTGHRGLPEGWLRPVSPHLRGRGDRIPEHAPEAESAHDRAGAADRRCRLSALGEVIQRPSPRPSAGYPWPPRPAQRRAEPRGGTPQLPAKGIDAAVE